MSEKGNEQDLCFLSYVRYVEPSDGWWIGDVGRRIRLFNILWYKPSSYLPGRTEEKHDKLKFQQVVVTVETETVT
jgi:hypothetical protein